jgi:hypothetical protein
MNDMRELYLGRTYIAVGGLLVAVCSTNVVRDCARWDRDLKILRIPSSIDPFSGHCFESCRHLREVGFEPRTRVFSLPFGVFSHCGALSSMLISRCEKCFVCCDTLSRVRIEECAFKKSPFHGFAFPRQWKSFAAAVSLATLTSRGSPLNRIGNIRDYSLNQTRNLSEFVNMHLKTAPPPLVDLPSIVSRNPLRPSFLWLFQPASSHV